MTQERIVKTQDVFTVSLLKSKSKDQLSPVEREEVVISAKHLSDEFKGTKTAKMILAVSGSDVPYKVSELLEDTKCLRKILRPQLKRNSLNQMK